MDTKNMEFLVKMRMTLDVRKRSPVFCKIVSGLIPAYDIGVRYIEQFFKEKEVKTCTSLIVFCLNNKHD
jgi:hypothetical protein